MESATRLDTDEVRERARIILEELLELYEITNPNFKEKSEVDKLEHARDCIRLFWEMFDLVGYWAQCQIIAYSRSKVDASFASSVVEENEGVHTDSHILESIGNDFLQAMGDDFSNPDLNYFESDAAHLAHRGAYAQLLRFFLFEMLYSSSPQSHPWRFLLQKALRAMNMGQTEALMRPMPVRKSGTPFSLAEWKHETVLQVYYRVGQGMKKYRVLELVADAIGQSVETLRDWEQDSKADEEYRVELQCAEIAGRNISRFKTEGKPMFNVTELGIHRGKPVIEIAFDLANVIEARSFGEIAQNIQKFRQR